MKLTKRLVVIGSGSWNAPIWRGLKQAIEKMTQQGEPVLHLWTNSDPHDGAKQILDFDPDVLIFCGCGRLGRQVGPWAKLLTYDLKHIPRGFWMNDLRPAHRAGEIRGAFSHVFLCWSKGTRRKDICRGADLSTDWWAKETKAHVMYMPQGAGIYERLQSAPPTWESIFIGNIRGSRWHDGRAEIAKRLGCYVLNSTNGKERDLIESRMPYLYRASKYVISMSPRVPGYTSARTYKILSCGGLMLMHSFPGAQLLFNHGEHALLFDTPGQARRLMRAYGGEKLMRQQIAEQGWKLQQERHTTEMRLRNMVANMTTSDQSFWGYL